MNINYGIGPFTCQQESKERRNGEGTEQQRWGGREEEMKKVIPKTIQLPLDYLKFLPSPFRSGEICHSMIV